MSNDSLPSQPDSPKLPHGPGELPAAPIASKPSTNQEPRAHSASARRDQRPPSLVRQAWNLAESLASFVADGCHLVTAEQYRQRLEICDACEARRDNRCMKCGCRLSLKARGRAFQCPAGKWPDVRQEP